ncbi:PLP-dependent aminotransferase family protein [Plantactinospora sp. GCM10030261]|uniref:aminotransferase-like domain-containing protein n=1 Tax=Plantactinospora sp. GCM10030261 TaxID=3273420 RepID=UPI00360B3EFF
MSRTVPPTDPVLLEVAGRAVAVDDARPVYQRIADGIAAGIDGGRLRPGDRLPTHRALASELGVAVPTISRAYREAQQRGLISGTVGRGTFITGIPSLRDRPGTDSPARVDLSVNAPARGEHEHLLRASLRATADAADLSGLLSYEADIGGPADRAVAADWLSLGGWRPDPANVVICHGGQHAILVALGAVVRPGGTLLTEALTYPGVKVAAQLLGLRVVGVEMDEHGILPAALDEAAAVGADPAGAAAMSGAPLDARRPTAVYLMPTAHNPTAITLSPTRRREVIAVARRRDLSIIEDDVFGLLAPEHDRPFPLAALAPERTLHLSSLSKTVTPGLRWGAIVAPAQLTDRLGALVRASIFNPAPVALALARRWLTDGTAERMLAWQRAELADRFATAERLLAGRPAVRSLRTGGLHAWLDLAEPWTPAEVVAAAARLGVDLGPTSFFHADPSGPTAALARGIRLCLGNAAELASLDAALTALADALDRGPTFASGTRV